MAPILGYLNNKQMVAISVSTIMMKNTNQKKDTLFCGLVSKPIGAGNSKTVRARIMIMAII
jgi:hypothetical protein